ncbi:MarR family winged helix-turn-helix transcriptional regulator [Sanguibacter sp. HDW7]|uniref:MarR family winged helix-turn-helix transcriptional regulator n=1 Tax=Sanguibacter sp. HDW7 TaxID=2714931 RepID=UPI0014074752|nr:MarR family transcriptional regulator [Sanguibacter sp. HDW7]QIK83782.1 MarR family transcriptional regulator [Sanguibacter sp. HDW7]
MSLPEPSDALPAARDHVAALQAEWRRERPDLDVGPQGVVGRLHRLAKALTAELVAVYAQHGLTEGEFDVLATLRRSGEPFTLAAGELAARTMVTTGGMTKRLDRLESSGLVTRTRADDDGRGRVVTLTADGRSRIDAAFTDHIANEHRLLDVLEPADAADLERLLTTWGSRLELD